MEANQKPSDVGSEHRSALEDHSVEFRTEDAASKNAETKANAAVNPSPNPSTNTKHSSKSKRRPSKKSKEQAVQESSSSTSSTSTTDSNSLEDISDSSSSSSSSSDDQKSKKQRKKNKKKKKRKESAKKLKTSVEKKTRKISKHSTVDSDSDQSDSDSSDEDASENESKLKRRSSKGKASKKNPYEDSGPTNLDQEQIWQNDRNLQLTRQFPGMPLGTSEGVSGGLGNPGLNGRRFMPRRVGGNQNSDVFGLNNMAFPQYGENKKPKPGKRASTLAFKRVDQLWDSTIHNYKLTESARDQEDEFDQYVFTVRRRFDWENKYKNTVVDIKSKLLKEALQDVMKDVKGVSLVEDRPSVDPNMLFLYLEELRTYSKKTLKARLKAEEKRKNRKKLALMMSECKVLISYLDQDYEETKKTLYPMLEAGNITFELLWALFKPNAIAYTPTYGNSDEPRCFKVDYATKESSFMRGEWYCIEGRYLEYDGRAFGMGDFESQIDAFKGPRKITSLATYPLIYHKDPEGVKAQLIERGKKFVSLEGMNYRFHKGMAFMKKKKAVAKVNINGRIMVDPAIFRRINPNYPISTIKPKDPEDDLNQSDDEDCDCCGSDSEQGGNRDDEAEDIDTAAFAEGCHEGSKERTRFKVIRDKDNNVQIVQVTKENSGQDEHVENLDKLPDSDDSKHRHEFTEEELILASPVVLGFAFSEKLWLEFTISGLRSIEWNEGAFDSLVLPANQKSIVKALVESHKFHAAKTIDDVVQGKGKGLVAVLHGPPGTGKTLTAEGIAELLKCPLYMVSAGELGTDPRMLEHELQKILDIAHSWGAVLLLDEADVFLEKREVHDIHRNALVSIFLRLLEYFQGILFLTTNRVETFDDAFQSRIHVALRYGELTPKAKKAVWKLFLAKVREMEQSLPKSLSPEATSNKDEAGPPIRIVNEPPTPCKTPEPPLSSNSPQSTLFKETDYDALSRRSLNGRQIKNAVRTSQALAVNREEPLSMKHILEVLEVAESFEADLKGGTGYADAMRSYT